MSISVLNTDADLSGKTLVTAEGSRTVSGLITFDRDPNPPFAVSSASTVVANLIADDVDGPSSTYVPTFNGTIGNAVTTGSAYIQIGKLVYFQLKFVAGNTTVFNSTTAFGLPVTAAASGLIVGSGMIIDSGTGNYGVVAFSASTTTFNLYVTDGLVTSAVTATAPATWTTNDTFYVTGSYIAA